MGSAASCTRSSSSDVGQGVIAGERDVGTGDVEDFCVDVRAKPEVVGERHLGGAIAQHRTNIVRLGFDDLDFEIGMFGAEFGDEAGKDERSEGDETRDADAAAYLAGLTAGRVQDLAEVLEQGPRVPQHLLTCGGEDEPASTLPDEQLSSDLMLEL